MWRPDTPVTRCYWDAFALLPAFAPEGPISILGLVRHPRPLLAQPDVTPRMWPTTAEVSMHKHRTWCWCTVGPGCCSQPPTCMLTAPCWGKGDQLMNNNTLVIAMPCST